MALTPAERQAAYIARMRAGIAPTAKPRRPADRRSKPKQWLDALDVLDALLDGWEEARDNVPEALTDGAYATKLDAVLDLREHVEALREAEMPLGFGRD